MSNRLRLRRRSLVVVLAAAALLAACGGDSGSGPADTRLAGTWVMRLADGVTLPAVVSSAPNAIEKLLGGTLAFADTTVADSVAFATFDSTGTPTAASAARMTLRYTSQEDGLVLVERPGGAAAIDTGVVVGDTLRFKVHALGHGTTAPVLLLYTRGATP